MKLSPGTPLAIALLTDEAASPRPVGRLAMADGTAQLEWSAQAIAAKQAISPLFYPLESGLHPARSRDFEGLHGFLADSLPDAWGTLLLRRRLHKLGHRFEDLDAVDRLALIGRSGRGALVYQPETLDRTDVEGIDLDRLAEEARQVLLGEDTRLDDVLAQLGGGSGGARPKVHVAFTADGRPGPGAGQVGEEWIVKFASPVDPADIGPLEEAYARMARAAGIDMAESRLIASRMGPGYFAARRFDRPGAGKRRHMVSLGGAVEARPHMPSLDYDGFLKATLAITRDMRDVDQAFRRMVFNVLGRNRDDHVRQHAFLMDERGEWRLAPAFDLTFANGPGGEHYMAVEGEGNAITRQHVETLGARHGIARKRIAEIVEAVREALGGWPRHARETGVGVSLATVSAGLDHVARQFHGTGQQSSFFDGKARRLEQP